MEHGIGSGSQGKKRILVAGLFHETHTFLSGRTMLSDFETRKGAEIWACAGDASPLGGVLEFGKNVGWEMIPLVDYRATPGAMVADEVIDQFWREWLQLAEPEWALGVDAIYLVLHGAMVSESLDDVEGEILSRIRSLPGAADLPIFGVFDLHANFSQRMADHADCLVAYRANPHTDAREAGLRAADLLKRCLDTGRRPKMHWMHPPLMWPPTGTATAVAPMLTLENRAREMEAGTNSFWVVNVVAGFSFADVAEAGVSFVIAASGADDEAKTALKELADLAMMNRAQGNVLDPPITDVMAELRSGHEGLTVLVEPSDNIGAGAPGDGTGLLRALLDHDITNAAVCICDEGAVRTLNDIEIGHEMELKIGGRGSDLDVGPVTLRVELVSRSDGHFELEDLQSHLASMCGSRFDMGPCAVVRYRGLTILLTSRKTPPFDLGQWRSQGLEPESFSVIGVKAAVAHRRAYDAIATRMIWVDTPGPCTSDLRSLPYRKIQRPIYPLDEI